MGSTSRLFMAAILLTLVAGVASAQDAGAAPPPQAPDVANPVKVDELKPIPVVDPNAPAAEPALTIDKSALTAEPVVPPTVDPPVAEKPATSTTTIKRVTKKIVPKPVESSSLKVSESFKADASVAAAATSDSTANMPPPNAAASAAPLNEAAPLKSVVVPAPPSDDSTAIEVRPEATRTMGIGGWLLAGIVVATLFGLITLYRRRRSHRPVPIVDFTGPIAQLELKPATAPRT